MKTLRSILVPIDGSPPSLAALDHALTLADDYGARIELLNVMQPRDRLGPAARDEIELALDDAYRHAKRVLGDRLSAQSVVGDALREIIDRSHDDIDLVVMGTHGRVGRLHSMLGSVAEGVVRNAPCPVLTVRDQSPGYQSFAERRHGRPSLAEQAHRSEPGEAHAHHRGR